MSLCPRGSRINAKVSAMTIYFAIALVVAIDLVVGLERAAINTTAEARPD